MVFEAVECPTCGGVDIHRHGQSAARKRRYICRNSQDFYSQLHLQRSSSNSKTTNRRDGNQWQWYQRYSPSTRYQSHHNDQRIKKEQEDIEVVNYPLLE